MGARTAPDAPEQSGESETKRAHARAAGDSPSSRKRHRRGRRGGRGRDRAATPAHPVEVETIPFEDDDLPGAGTSFDDLPELPAEAEILEPQERPAERQGQREHGRGSRRRGRDRQRERQERAEHPRHEEKHSEPAPRSAPRRKNVILVNAADREEVRVAVVESGQIVDFQMNVKRHKSLVNDIYRGRVVNLEPAIGAAFVDFGQGRNGFLHTSDVLSVYGDKDFTLAKLLTTQVDPEEWDNDAGAPDVGPDISTDLEERASASVADDGAANGSEVHDESPPNGADEWVENGADDGEAMETSDAGDALAESDDGELVEDEPSAPVDRAEKLPAPVRVERAARRSGRDRERRQARHHARPRLPITDLLEKGQVVVVQVTKDAIGDKGPTLTTYISIPGRHLVLMPSMARTGVSRKIEDDKERRRLKRILQSLDNLPPGMGVIVRTAGIGCTREDLQRDLDYLLALWSDFHKKLELGRGPAPLYEESDVAIRTVRDLFSSATEAVIVDDREVYDRVRDFTARLMPAGDVERIKLHEGPKPLFHMHNVEQDFERIFARRIDLPSGGSIVFDQTEALVAIDVNSGKTRSGSFEFEEIALKTNLEAAPEIARQIRLRDLGGIIVCDFIDMTRAGNRRAVERAFKNALALDRARSKLGRISQFGLLELTRQRLGPGLSKMLFHNCARCRGSGRLRTVESRAGAILRRLGAALAQKGFSKIEVRAAPEVVDYLQRQCGPELAELERDSEREIALIPISDQLEDSVLRYLRQDGREVRPGGRRKR
jgi:ribonuclease E